MTKNQRNWITGDTWCAAAALLVRAKARLKGVRVAAISLALLLCACAKVQVTPLGSTKDGRNQFEITCNKTATDAGSCNEKALALCGGSYETQSIGRTEPRPSSYNGQLFSAPTERLLLIACNPGSRKPVRVGLHL